MKGGPSDLYTQHKLLKNSYHGKSLQLYMCMPALSHKSRPLSRIATLLDLAPTYLTLLPSKNTQNWPT